MILYCCVQISCNLRTIYISYIFVKNKKCHKCIMILVLGDIILAINGIKVNQQTVNSIVEKINGTPKVCYNLDIFTLSI